MLEPTDQQLQSDDQIAHSGVNADQCPKHGSCPRMPNHDETRDDWQSVAPDTLQLQEMRWLNGKIVLCKSISSFNGRLKPLWPACLHNLSSLNDPTAMLEPTSDNALAWCRVHKSVTAVNNASSTLMRHFYTCATERQGIQERSVCCSQVDPCSFIDETCRANEQKCLTTPRAERE